VAAILGVIVLVGLTGGLHLDGFTDTVDGLAAWKGPEETLRIMRDSRIGVLGAAALFLILGLKWACLYTLPRDRLLTGLVSCCALSRWGMVLSGRIFRYGPGKTGLGRLVTEVQVPTAFWGATLLTIGVALACLGPLRGTSSLGLAAGMMWGLNRLFVGRLGGITGDTLGAVNEILEVSLLLFLFIP
jgi:adenosylcobinamide-GDP ribazoletransferase